MAFQLTQLAAPAAEPITLADARAYLRLDDAGEDGLVAELIAAARTHIERATGRSLMRQDWRIEWDTNGQAEFGMLRGPVTQILAVSLLDAGGTPTVVEAGQYAWLPLSDRVRLSAGCAGQRLRIDYRAGSAAAADVPAPLRQAVRAALLCFYEARDAGGAVPDAVGALAAPYRLLSL